MIGIYLNIIFHFHLETIIMEWFMVGYGSLNSVGKSNCDYRWWWQTTIKVDIGSSGGWLV